MTHSIALVCEGASDPPTIESLVDKAIIDSAHWTADNIDDHRIFRGFRTDERWLEWKHIKTLATKYGVTVRGHFDDEPANNETRTSLKAILLLDVSPNRPDAIILFRDSDGNTTRRSEIERARDHANLDLPVVVGVAHRTRECWYLVGFTPKSDSEAERLGKLIQDLSFNPCLEIDRLTGNQDHEPRSPKNVLRRLTDNDPDRAMSCLSDHSLEKLSQLGQSNGLSAFIAEIRNWLIPQLFGGPPPGSR